MRAVKHECISLGMNENRREDKTRAFGDGVMLSLKTSASDKKVRFSFYRHFLTYFGLRTLGISLNNVIIRMH